LLAAALAAGERCRDRVAAGVDPSRLEQVDLGPLLRAGEETAPEDAGGIAGRLAEVLAAVDAAGKAAAP
jgi:V/A-type H+-transporting ATPase subunit A